MSSENILENNTTYANLRLALKNNIINLQGKAASEKVGDYNQKLWQKLIQPFEALLLSYLNFQKKEDKLVNQKPATNKARYKLYETIKNKTNAFVTTISDRNTNLEEKFNFLNGYVKFLMKSPAYTPEKNNTQHLILASSVLLAMGIGFLMCGLPLMAFLGISTYKLVSAMNKAQVLEDETTSNQPPAQIQQATTLFFSRYKFNEDAAILIEKDAALTPR